MICFVVLHYITHEETIKCVDSLLNLDGDKDIVIVDNASPNNSVSILSDYYKNNKNVKILKSKENVGFAKGNNIGYSYAKNKKYDFIICLNNDITILQKNFIKELKRIYNSHKDCYVIGPDVYSTFSHVHQSPKRMNNYNLDDFKNELAKYKSREKSRFIIPLKCYLKSFKFIKRIAQFIKFNKKNIDYNKTYFNLPLHGSCVIFTRNFIKERDYAFNPCTFMYWEMEILDYELQSKNKRTMYSPILKVMHNHSVTSNVVFKNELKKERFVNKQVCNSLYSFLNLKDGDKIE